MSVYESTVYLKYVSSKKTLRKHTLRKPGHAKAKAEHEKFLLKMGISPTRKRKVSKKIEYTSYERTGVPTSDRIYSTSGKKENTYTGDVIMGIATMHKSNAVPIINKEQAKEISSMRR